MTELTVVKRENKDMDDKIRELQNRIAFLLSQEDEASAARFLEVPI